MQGQLQDPDEICLAGSDRNERGKALQLVKIWFLDGANSCILAEPNLKIALKIFEKGQIG
jgi:hypothetical protein